jgi:Ca2+/Na+ antiporter
MIHLLFISKILLLGLSIAQVLAMVQVYASNVEYYTFLSAVQDAGYLAVPNEHVFSTLRNLGPAFYGGLFFTLTAGIALTIISSALAWAWDRLFSRNRIVLLLFSALCILCTVSANVQGFSPLITAYLLFIPILVFRFTLKWLPEQPKDQSHKNILFPVIAFLMLPLIIIVWRPSGINEDRFLDVRDYLLLSNSFGRNVNAFYYENSLYSTRVFRAYGQQLLRSCRLEGISDPSLTTRMTGILLARDYLPLGKAVRPDLRIALSDKDLEFYSLNELVLKSSMRDFFRNPEEPLKQFEKRTERHRFLLGFTLFSIVFLGALFLFACIYFPFYLISGLFLNSIPRAVKARILWPVAFLLLFLAFSPSGTESLGDPQNLSEAITSDRLHSRIAALKYILRAKIDIAGFPAYPSMLSSQHIPERYWLAKALGVSRTPETRKALFQLLNDPHFNVVCMAVDSLGRRGNRADIPPILGKLETSRNWYEQWYTYRALRRLGWQQKESNRQQHM